MTLRLGGDGAITGCTSLENPDLTVSGLTISGSFDAEKVLVASGTAAAPSYTFSGDTDNGLYYAGTNSIGLSTAGTNAILIDSSGNVGIGASSPSRLLELKSSAPIIRLTESTNTYSEISANSSVLSFKADEGNGAGSTRIDFRVDGSEAMRIDSSGRLLVGTTTEGQANADNLTIADSGTCGITLRSASNNFGRIYFSDGTSGDAEYRGIIQYDHSADRMSFATNASVALTIDSSGNVGIGTSSPTSIAGYTGVTINNATNGGFIDLESNETAVFRFLTNGTVNNIETRTATPIVFLINSNERARIDSSGRLLVGTSSSTSSSSAQYAILQAQGSTNSATGGGIFSINIGNNGNGLVNGSYVGGLYFATSDTGEFAAIESRADGTCGAGDYPGRLVFSTTADGASSPTEKMRITSDAYVRLASGTGGIQFNGDTAADNALDDYEQGTFSPTLTYATPGTSSFSYTAQTGGYYRKIGSFVHCRIEIRLASFTKGTASGDLQISGLPFNATGGGTFGQFVGNFASFQAPLPTGAGDFPVVIVLLNDSKCQFKVIKNNNNWSQFPDPDGNSQFKIDVQYYV